MAKALTKQAKALLKYSHFRKGARVVYTPGAAIGNIYGYGHGVVCAVTENYIFVKYDNAKKKMVTGDEPYTAQATKKDDLVLE